MLVRERPPLRLSAYVLMPSGRAKRLGDNVGSPRDVPQNYSFSTVMPGGFEAGAFDLKRDPRRVWADCEELSTVTLRGPGGLGIAAEFRLEGLPSTSGGDSAISPQLVGWQSHLDDDSTVAVVFVDLDLTRWAAPSLNQQYNLETGTPPNWSVEQSQVITDEQTGYPRLQLTIGQNQPYNANTQPTAEAWYDAGPAKIKDFWYDVTFSPQAQNTNFSAVIAVRAQDDGGQAGANTSNLYAGNNTTASPEQSGYITPGTVGRRFAQVRWRYNAGSWAPAAPKSARFRIAVYGDHGLTKFGAAPGGLRASDMIAYVLSQWCPMLSFTTGNAGTIQDSEFVIPQAVYTDPTTASQVIADLVKYEMLDWAVWSGRRFYLSQRYPAGSMPTTKFWRARVDQAQLQTTGSSITRLWNGVVVIYQGADGNAHYVGPPHSGLPNTDDSLLDPDALNPANELGINRYATVRMLGSSSLAGAIAVGSRFLQEQKLLDRSGQATIIGHVLDDRGVFFPAWRIRAGDYISFVNANDTSYRRIVHTDYSDESKSAALQLDQPPDTLQALLERLQIVLVRFGLS